MTLPTIRNVLITATYLAFGGMTVIEDMKTYDKWKTVVKNRNIEYYLK